MAPALTELVIGPVHLVWLADCQPYAVTRRAPGDYLVHHYSPRFGWLPNAAWRTRREALARVRESAREKRLEGFD